MSTWMRLESVPEPDPREAKLPAWAREQMAHCRRIALESQNAARDARLSTDPDESGAVLDFHGDIPVGLGKRPEVTFRVPGRHRLDSYISVRHDARSPERLYITGACAVIVRLSASNAFTVELERDR